MNCGILIQWNITQQQKEKNKSIDIQNNMDEPQEHYSYMLCDSIYLTFSKQENIEGQKQISACLKQGVSDRRDR